MRRQPSRKRAQRDIAVPRTAPRFDGLSLSRTRGRAEDRDAAFADTIRSIPRGKVATYGQIAAAAGYPRYHRAVARLLRNMGPHEFPWQRVVGAGGAIKVSGQGADEQRLRLRREGVAFTGDRINLAAHQYFFEGE